MNPAVPLLVAFAAPSSIQRDAPRPSDLPIVGNGPPGTFVLLPDLAIRVSLPTDQIVYADESDGCVRVGFGGMRFAGLEGESLVFVREREVRPEADLSPARSHVMRLDARWVTLVAAFGRREWPA